jgi:hypothetical protein
MLVGKDFNKNIICSYDRIYHCDEIGCSDVCRCSTIENVQILHVDTRIIEKFIYGQFFDESRSAKRDMRISAILHNMDSDVNLYTINRILSHYKIWKDDVWDITKHIAYYGEEILKIALKDDVARLIENTINDAFLIDDITDRIRFLILLEYGYIIDILSDKKFEVTTIRKEDIYISNLDYLNSLTVSKLFPLQTNIKGIVIDEGDKYRLIDGYHRYLQNDDYYFKVIVAN